MWQFGRQGGRNAEQAHPSAGPRQTARGNPRMNPTLLALPAAFGLAGASGLNASLPLLLISLLARLGLIQLAPPFDALQTDVAFYGILALAVVETTVDKIPALDSVGQALMVPLAATSGAIVFASQLGAIQQVDPGLQVVISLLLGGGTATAVHLTRSAVRPVLNLALLGVMLPRFGTEGGGVARFHSAARRPDRPAGCARRPANSRQRRSVRRRRPARRRSA